MIVQNLKTSKISLGKQKFFGFCKVRNHRYYAGFLSILLVYNMYHLTINQRRRKMENIQRTLPEEDTTTVDTLYMAIELSHTEWKLAFSTGEKIRTVTVDARD